MTNAIRLASSTDRDAWLAARAEGVTATEVHRLAQGGLSARKAILADKLNGSEFHGNQHTARGNRREPILADWIERKFGIPPNSWLYQHGDFDKHLATPDGLGYPFASDYGEAGAEVKSHAHGWRAPAGVVPVEHYDQAQWGMWVTGTRRWLYVWEIMDADGYPPIEPDWYWIDREDKRILELRRAADDFLAWREAGAPDFDVDIDPELDAAISEHVAARAAKSAAEKIEKAAELAVRRIIDANPDTADIGMKASGSAGQVTFTVTSTEVVELDREAWEADAPADYASHVQLVAALAQAETEAKALYPKSTTKRSTRLSITAHKKE